MPHCVSVHRIYGCCDVLSVHLWVPSVEILPCARSLRSLHVVQRIVAAKRFVARASVTTLLELWCMKLPQRTIIHSFVGLLYDY